jgi:hypothetical protein
MPDLPGLQFWMNVSRQGAALDQIATQFVNSAEFKSLYGSSSNDTLVEVLYQNDLGRSSDAAGKAYRLDLLQKGTSTGSVLTAFTLSSEFHDKSGLLLANAMSYYAFMGRAPTTTELEATATDLTTVILNASAQAPVGNAVIGLTYSGTKMTEAVVNDGSFTTAITISLLGDTFKGSIGASLGKVTGTPTGLTASLIKVTDTTASFTLTGNAKAHGIANSTNAVSIAFTTKDFTSASLSGKAGVTQPLALTFIEIPLVESNGDMALSGAISASLSIDLTNNKFLFGTTAALLTSGTVANVKNINASGVTSTSATVSIIGNDANNVITASDLGGTLTGGKGNDTLIAGAKVDRFVFAATTADNGVDSIQGFALGTGGDMLNFSAFLNKTGTGHITPVSVTSKGNAPWTNGDVLVATGNGLTTADGVAALFNAGASDAPFSQPSTAAKSAPAKFVIITADIVGDASVWYVVNQTNTAIIEASEITLVGTLEGVNNLDLTGYGFVAANFA